MFLHKQPDFKKSEIKGRKGGKFLMQEFKKNIEKSLAAANTFRGFYLSRSNFVYALPL
jgi:hypothetical protein